MTLTSAQLQQLTDRLNGRLAEFGEGHFDLVSAGIMRQAWQVIEEWQEEHEPSPLQIRHRDGGMIELDAATLAGAGLSFANLTDTTFENLTTPSSIDEEESNADRYYKGFNDGVDHARFERLKGGMITAGELATIAINAGYDNLVDFTDRYDLVKCAECGLYGTHGENMRQIEGDYYCDLHYPADPEADLPPQKDAQKYSEPSPRTDADYARELDAYTQTMLGPEHVVITPLKPIGRDHDREPVRLTDRQLRRAVAGENVGLDGDDPDDDLDDDDGDLDLDDDDEPAQKRKRRTTSRWEMTPARRASIDKAKKERWEASRVSQRGGYIQPTLEQIVSELKRQSMGGVQPTIAQFDAARPANWATADAAMKRFSMSWGDFAEAAGLRARPQSRAQRAPGEAQPVMA